MDAYSITRPTLLRDQILAILRDEILNRRPVGSQMPIESELVRQFKVSRKTVRMAYAVLEGEGLIERYRGRGTFVIAKTPRSRRTGEVDLVFFSSTEAMFLVPFYSQLIGAISGSASAGRFYVRLLTHDAELRQLRYDWQEHAALLEKAMACLAVGVFKPDALASLARRMPLVAVDTGGPFEFCDSVVADDFEAGRLATQHLLDLGHRRIGFLGYLSAVEGMLDPAHVRRHEGYCAAMSGAQLWPGEDLQFDIQGAGQAAYRSVSAALQLPDPPTAFVAVGGARALEGVDAAASLGRRVPRDVSFVGIGDALPSSTSVRLTTIDLDPERIGRTAVALLQRRLAEPSAPPVHEVIPVQLIERETTATATW